MKKVLFVLLVLCLSISINAQEKELETMKKVVIARLNVKSDAVDQFLQSAEIIVNKTRKEEGCITYILYKSSFSPENEFIFYEEYKDQQALNVHNNSEYLANFLKQVTPMLTSEPIVDNF